MCEIRKRHRLKHPARTAYYQLCSNAKVRGIPVLISRADFINLCNAHNYFELRGRSSSSLTLDRIDNTKGYSLDNIQFLTKHANSVKGVIERVAGRTVRSKQ